MKTYKKSEMCLELNIQEYIERHFTLDRTFKETDHAVSLELEGITKLKKDLDLIWKAQI